MGDAHAPALVDRGLRLHDAFLVLAVVVGVELEAGRHRRLEQSVIERVLVGHGRDLERAAGATAVAAVAVDEILDAGEQRRHLVPAPAAVAHLRPGVVVERLATHPDQPIDRPRTAQQLAARHRDVAVGRAGFGFGLVEPVGRRIVDQQAEAERHAGIGMAGRAGLEQQHPGRRIFAEACGQGAAGRAGADDDVVIVAPWFLVPPAARVLIAHASLAHRMQREGAILLDIAALS